MSVWRVYADDELGPDGYPPEWHGKTLRDDLGIGVLTEHKVRAIKDLVREQAEHRCVRCFHPYRNGEHGNGEWTPCSVRCQHAGPYRIMGSDGEWREGSFDVEGLVAPRLHAISGQRVEAQWRILTVHHLDGDKANCRWWNLASLCQRCHLTIQGRVIMARVWPWEHSDWFKPYVAGYYASVYLGEELERDEVERRLDELLDLERAA